MFKRVSFVLLFAILVGCSNNESENIEANTEGQENENNVVVENETVENEENNNNNENSQSMQSVASVENNVEEERENEEGDELEILEEKFWEVYEGDEIIYAARDGVKVYDFDREAAPFEEAIIESMENDDGKDWSPYFGSFTLHTAADAPEGYMMAMNKAYEEHLNQDNKKVIEYLIEAREIRETSNN